MGRNDEAEASHTEAIAEERHGDSGALKDALYDIGREALVHMELFSAERFVEELERADLSPEDKEFLVRGLVEGATKAGIEAGELIERGATAGEPLLETIQRYDPALKQPDQDDMFAAGPEGLPESEE